MQKLISKVILFFGVTLLGVSNISYCQVSNISNPVKFFTGRDNILQSIKKELSIHKAVIVSGIAGIGKTEVVRQYAFNNKASYDILWTVDCARDLEDEFAILRDEINYKICNSMHCRIQTNTKNVAELTMKFLTQSNLRWLLVFENWSDASLRSYLPILSDLKQQQHCIVVSRKLVDYLHYISLDFLDKNSSLDFLSKLLPDKSKEDLVKIHKIYNGYPILMFQAATYLNIQRHITVDEFIELHRVKNKYLDAEKNIDSFFQLTMQNFSSSVDKKLLSIFVIMDNHGIDKSFIHMLLQDEDRGEYLKAVDNMVKFNLITIKNEEKKMEFSMHDFLKEEFKEILDKNMQKEVLQDIVQKVNAFLGNNWVDIAGKLEKDSNLKNNLIALLKNLNEEKIFDVESLKFRTKMGLVFFTYLDYQNTKNVLEDIKPHINKLEDDKDSIAELINFYYCLGMYMEFTGESFKEAIVKYSRALELANEIKDMEHMCVLRCMLAQVEIYSGGLSAAVSHISEAEKILDSGITPKNDGLFAFVKSKILMEEGRYQEALDLANKELIKEENNKNEEVGVFDATAYLLKAEILTRQGKYQTALDLLNTKVKQTLKELDKSHELRGRILNIYSVANLGIGRLDEALMQIEESLEVLKQAFNVSSYETSYDEDIGVALKIKGDVLVAKNLLKDAIKCYELSLKVQKNRYGVFQTDLTSMTIFALVKAYLNSKNILPANEYVLKHEEIYGVNHNRTQEMYKLKLRFEFAA